MAAEQRWARFAPDIAKGLEHHRAGRLDKAATIYRRVLDKAPDHPDALHMLGAIATARGRPERAIQLITRALGTLAHVPELHLNLGNAQHAVGRTAEAIASYRTAIALNPDFALAHSSLGRELSATRDFAGALASCRRAAELDPDSPDAWLQMGVALHGLGRLDEADASFRRTLVPQPRHAEALRRLAMIAVERSRFEEALVWQRRVLDLRPEDPETHRALGVLLFRTGRIDEALRQFERTVRLAPGDTVSWRSFGWAYRALGQFDKAGDCFRRAQALDPENPEARRELADIGMIDAGDAELNLLRQRLESEANPRAERITAGFAAGILLDKAGRFDDAFASFARGNALVRQSLLGTGRAYDSRGMTERVDRLIAAYTSRTLDAISSGDTTDGPIPVFIVGMPRSGTTLVEQILASHELVFGAGELTDIAAIAARMAPPPSEPSMAAAWASDAHPLATAYLGRLGVLGGGAPLVVDKQPDNLLHVGLIAALLPSARIVLCERDPRDTCLSNYFQLFAGGNPWSYDLAECGHRCREAMRLAEHWLRVRPDMIHRLSYENLVADFEGEARRLLAFLGLGWDPACLAFHRTERVVLTPSAWQVRQELFSSSVGRWRHYERHLGPLFAALNER